MLFDHSDRLKALKIDVLFDIHHIKYQWKDLFVPKELFIMHVYVVSTVDLARRYLIALDVP